jgi:hypothetical protein
MWTLFLATSPAVHALLLSTTSGRARRGCSSQQTLSGEVRVIARIDSHIRLAKGRFLDELVNGVGHYGVQRQRLELISHCNKLQGVSQNRIQHHSSSTDCHDHVTRHTHRA